MTATTKPDPTVHDRAGLEILSQQECLALLRSESVGRLAFVEAGEPVILPINYAMAGTSVVFRTALGGKLDAASLGRPAAFEIDGLDETYKRGWSVLVKGILQEVTEDEDLAEVGRLTLQPWARRVEKPFYVRLLPTGISGRRVV